MGNPNDETHDLRPLGSTLRDTEVIPCFEAIRSPTPTACLVCIHTEGSDRGKRFLIGSQGLVIGRGDGCEISVNDQSVSRHHARIELRRGGLYHVIDLGSSNGTFVNNIRVRTEILKDGCYVRVGDSIFRFLVSGNIEAAYHEEIQRLSIIDPLTGVYNRRYLDEFLRREIERSCEQNCQLSIILFDLDHFKAINDKFGHLAGDFTLEDLAIRIKTLTRTNELLARYGGEEFALILPETSLDLAIARADHFRRAVAECPFEFEGQTYPVTLSGGIGFMDAGEVISAPDLLRQADERLYQAKQGGRNQIVPMACIGHAETQSTHVSNTEMPPRAE